jgi:hypothetical protein
MPSAAIFSARFCHYCRHSCRRRYAAMPPLPLHIFADTLLMMLAFITPADYAITLDADYAISLSHYAIRLRCHYFDYFTRLIFAD